MRILRSHGITKDSAMFEQEAPGPWSYEQQSLGFNYRMNDIQAALGISQLKRLDQIMKERHLIQNYYKEELASLPFKFLENPRKVYSSLHLSIIRLENQDANYHKRIFENLRAAGIGVQLHYSPVHLQPFYRKRGFRPGDFIEAESYGTNAISLPIYPGLKDADLEYIKRTT